MYQLDWRSEAGEILQSFPVPREDGADGGGEECPHPAVSQVLGHPHVPLLAPAGPPAVLDIPELSQLVLNYFILRPLLDILHITDLCFGRTQINVNNGQTLGH